MLIWLRAKPVEEGRNRRRMRQAWRRVCEAAVRCAKRPPVEGLPILAPRCQVGDLHMIDA